VLPLGKRGESILGDLHEEYALIPDPRSLIPSRSLWYWQQTLRLAARYAMSRTPQQALTYPRSSGMWHDFTSDLRTAARMFMRSPGTSAIIVATLALAIGAATIGFSFADLILFRGIPADDPKVVVSVFASDIKGSTNRARVSALDYLAFRDRATTLERISVMAPSPVGAALITNGQSRTISVALVTGDAMAALGQRAVIGRPISPGDDTADSPKVVILAHHFWKSEYETRPDVVGQTMQLGRDFYTIVGVMAPALEFGSMAAYDVWLPMIINRESPATARDLRILARLKPGVSFEQAGAEVAAIGDALAAEHPDTNGGWKARLVWVRELTGGDEVWIVIALFLLSVGLIMAIATANVSNLVMVRALARQRELAVRVALGARRSRIVRQFIVEGGALSLAAAAISVPLTYAGLQIIQWIGSEPILKQLAIDLHELSFVASLALICPLFFSIAPARTISRTDTRQILAATGARGTTGSLRGRGWLVVAQVSLAVILLTASTLATRSVNAIYSKPTGIDGADKLTLRLSFDDAQYPEPLQASAAAQATRDALARLPGVSSVAMLSALPILGGEAMAPFAVDGVSLQPGEAAPSAVLTAMSAEGREAMGLRLLTGAWWGASDTDVAVISREMATRYFDGVDSAVGRAFSYQAGGTQRKARVIGVSSDVLSMDFSRPAVRIWTPMDQPPRRVSYLVRTVGDAAGISGPVRTTIAEVAPAIPIENMETYAQGFARARSSDDVIIAVLGGFAGVALLLASAGLFGIVSYTAAQRTAEFGTRMALGASAWDVIQLVSRQSLKLMAIGLSIGLAGGVAVGGAMGKMLNGLSPADPLSLTVVSGLLIAIALVATAIPALRASRIDPVIALRAD
jgi:putative ABC transport system permease protein